MHVGPVLVRAVPAAHDGNRPPFGPRAEAIGFLLSAPDRTRVYFAGDTALHPAMSELTGVNCALLPVWGWGTSLGPGHLDPVTAARAVQLIEPSLVVPVHWGTFLPMGLRTLRPDSRQVLHEPPRRLARLLGENGLAGRVEVPTPGRPIPLPR